MSFCRFCKIVVYKYTNISIQIIWNKQSIKLSEIKRDTFQWQNPTLKD